MRSWPTSDARSADVHLAGGSKIRGGGGNRDGATRDEGNRDEGNRVGANRGDPDNAALYRAPPGVVLPTVGPPSGFASVLVRKPDVDREG
ncbi:MAG: hypothetical protein EA387_06095 [Nitriliruptor sp.]|nr:MAG: hypothetical protein EA387_06095 [Nitriliruptor sp.]